jgi:hypothetical protein
MSVESIQEAFCEKQHVQIKFGTALRIGILMAKALSGG